MSLFYLEMVIPLVTSVFGMFGGLLVAFRAPKGKTTFLLAASLLLLSLTEACIFLFFLRESSRWIVVYIGLEPVFAACWLFGLDSSFARASSGGQRFINAYWSYLIVAGLLFVVVVLFPSRFLAFSTDEPDVVFLQRGGRLLSLLTLFPSVFLLWRIETIFRSASHHERWSFKYPFIGILIISGCIIWQAGLRLTYNLIEIDHLPLYSAVTFCGLSLFLFFAVRHKLFDMRIFVSRYVVYNSVALASIGLYLLGLGIIGVGIRYMGFTFPFIIKWLFIFVSALFLVVLLLSHDIRTRVKYFINTHFYENKYDYRHEWVNMSSLLSKATSKKEVLNSLKNLIQESMFVRNVSIWLGSDVEGYALWDAGNSRSVVSPDAPLVEYLKDHPYFLNSRSQIGWDETLESAIRDSTPFLQECNVNLAAPLSCTTEFFGFVAVDEEISGNAFNQDDVDLISALSSQAAISLMTIKLGLDLSEAREISLMNRVGAFVLHDLKNAAAMLSLLLQSAPKHIANPEFQEDLLEAIANAHARLEKVMKRLKFAAPLEEKKQAAFSLSDVVASVCGALENQWSGVTIRSRIAPDVQLSGSADYIRDILENLFLNAKEAMNGKGMISVTLGDRTGQVVLEVADNGKGMSSDFVEKRLFRPFQTTKEQGLGIGLWQVKHYVESMGGKIDVDSGENRGTTFFLTFPALKR